MANWTTNDMPSQHGRTAIVTGTGGLGFQCALALARGGAKVIIAGRNSEKGLAALNRIYAASPAANASFETLDLASLNSVNKFAVRLRDSVERIDLLINNAAVMAPPKRTMTVDNFELQLGTNYLGHFALTAGLLPLLRRGNNARVVSVSSIAARSGAIDFLDLHCKRNYKPMNAYNQSKLACLLFAFELQRRSEAGNWGFQSIAAHPGVSRTDLFSNGSGADSASARARRVLWFFFQPPSKGALPTLFAATAIQARGGAYYGPDKFGETRGHPAPARIPKHANDIDQASQLWIESERLTGAAFA